MPRTQPRGIEEQALSEIEAEIKDASSAIATEAGPAMGATTVSDDQAVRVWGVRDPGVDRQQLILDLMDGGLDPQTVAQLAVVRENPDLAPLYGPPQDGRPLDQQMADYLARLAEYPYRHGILRDYEDDPEEQVSVANRLGSRWQKAQAERVPRPLQGPQGPVPPAGIVVPGPGQPPGLGQQTISGSGTGSATLGFDEVAPAEPIPAPVGMPTGIPTGIPTPPDDLMKLLGG